MSAPFASFAEPFTAETLPLTCTPSASRSVPFTVSMLDALAPAPSETPPLTLSTFLHRRVALDIDGAVDGVDIPRPWRLLRSSPSH